MPIEDIVKPLLPPLLFIFGILLVILGILLLIAGLIVLFIHLNNVPLYSWILIGIGTGLFILGIILLIINWFQTKPSVQNLGSFGTYREIY